MFFKNHNNQYDPKSASQTTTNNAHNNSETDLCTNMDPCRNCGNFVDCPLVVIQFKRFPQIVHVIHARCLIHKPMTVQNDVPMISLPSFGCVSKRIPNFVEILCFCVRIFPVGAEHLMQIPKDFLGSRRCIALEFSFHHVFTNTKIVSAHSRQSLSSLADRLVKRLS